MTDVVKGIAVLKCKTSSVDAQSQVIGKLSSCSLERSREMIEIVSLTSDFNEKLAGTRSWSMSADGNIDFTDGGQSTLISCYMKKELINVDLEVNGEVQFSGSVFIESLNVGISAGEAATISISMVGNGKLLMINK